MIIVVMRSTIESKRLFFSIDRIKEEIGKKIRNNRKLYSWIINDKEIINQLSV